MRMTGLREFEELLGKLSSGEKAQVLKWASTEFGSWPHIAIKDKSEIWSPEANNIVSKCASAEISVRSGDSPTLAQISEAIEEAA